MKCTFRTERQTTMLTEHDCDIQSLDWIEDGDILVQVIAPMGCREFSGVGSVAQRPFAVRRNGKVSIVRLPEDQPVTVCRHLGDDAERRRIAAALKLPLSMLMN